MKMYLISDNVDTLMGMRLAGIEGEVVHSKKHIEEALDRAISDDDIAVVLMTETLMKKCHDRIYDIKLNYKKPLIIEIPDRHGQGRTKDSITRYVQDAIGVKM